MTYCPHGEWLNVALETARKNLREMEYDCLECEGCYPALALAAVKTIIDGPE